MSTPLQTGFTRVFLQKYGASPANAIVYHNCMRFGSLEQAFGDITKIECPHPSIPDAFVEVGRIKSASERPTTQLVGHYPANEASILKEFADLACDFEAYMVIGTCDDVSNFNKETDKTLVFDSVSFTNLAIDELGTLSSEGRAEVNETADISMKAWYEVIALTFAARAGDIVTNEVVDVIVSDAPSCGDCSSGNSDGCQNIYAITLSAGGSPSTPADVVYSVDKGATWYAVDIDTLSAAQDPTGVAAIGEYLVVVSNDSNSLHYALLSDFDTTPTVTWTEVTTGFVSGGEPNDIWSVGNTAFVVGDGGYVYKCIDPTSGVTVIDAGASVSDDLQAVHAISDTFMVAVGNAGAIVKTENGSTVTAVTPRPVGVGVNLTAVWVKENDSNQWWIGGNDGNLRYTINNGVTWTTQGFAGSGSGVIRDIAFSTKQIGFISHSTTTPVGRLFKTKNGGASWVLQPTSLVPDNDRLTAIATCQYDVNFVVGGGLGANGSDGIMIVGED